MFHSFVLHKNGQCEIDVPLVDLAKILKDDKALVWVDFEATDETENRALTEVFDFHPLAVEDCINTSEHPKIDKYDTYLFLVLHAINFGRKKDEEISTLELNMFVGHNYILTYHRKTIRSVVAIRERCAREPQTVLGDGVAFLVHKIVDALVDNYLPTISLLDHEIDRVEDELFDDASEELLNTILMLRKDAMHLKRIIGQQRNIIYKLAHTKYEFIGQDSQIYFSDIYDQLYKFVDQLDSYRDLLNGIVDMYMSFSSVRMNQIMKTLTVLMTILMPLTLITGIYGMNFKYMPEVESPYGYYLTIGFMIILAIVMGIFMKRKKWF